MNDPVHEAYIEMCALLYSHVREGEDEVECLRRLVGEIAELKLEIERHKRSPDFLGEALNSGDGVYRP